MTHTAATQPDRTALGIAAILAGAAAAAIGDALVKLTSADMTVWQIFAARAVFSLICLLGVARLTRRVIRARHAGWVVLRSGLLILAWLAYYAALPVLDLAVAAVVVYTNPIMTALMAAFVLSATVHRIQWAGVLIGFLGVLAILRPGGDGVTWAVILPLLGAFLYSAAMLLTRLKCRDEDFLTLAIGLHLAFLVSGLAGMGLLALIDPSDTTRQTAPFLLGGAVWMTPGQWTLMAGLGALAAAFSVGVAFAYQAAPPQIIATFDYSYLIFAALGGWLLFAETPGPATLIGMALITCAGLLVARPPSRS